MSVKLKQVLWVGLACLMLMQKANSDQWVSLVGEFFFVADDQELSVIFLFFHKVGHKRNICGIKESVNFIHYHQSRSFNSSKSKDKS